jgi:hypothetical protein
MDKSLSFPLLISDASAYLLSQTAASSQAEPFDAAESDIRPRPLPSLGDVGTSLAAASRVPIDRWPWLVAAVIMLLGTEWLVFARRG